MKRDVIAEIENVRSRMADVDDFDSGIFRLLRITISTATLADDDQKDETRVHFIVASVAALESYFRWQIRRIIDFEGRQCLSNIRLDEQPVKLNHEVAIALLDKRLTVGEFIAHTVGFSNFEKVAAFVTKLLGTDFVRLLETARDHDGSPVLENSSQVISDVKRTLELRHLICHEGHKTCFVANSEIKRLSMSCYSFARGCLYSIAHFLDPNALNRLEDRHAVVLVQASESQKHLITLEGRIARRLHGTREQDAFRAMVEAWNAYMTLEAAFFASVQMNGSQGVIDALRTHVRLTDRRIKELRQWLGKLERTDAFVEDRYRCS